MKFYIFLISFILVMGFASAVITTLPDYVKIGECVNLVQNDNVTSETLISVVKPNEIVYINKAMTKNNTFFNYTFCDNDVSGGYTVNGQDNTGIAWSYDYNVNAQGKQYGSVDGLLYIIAILVLLGLFGVSLYGFFMIPFENPRGGDGIINAISYKKYLKIFSLVIAYVSFLAVSYFLWNLTYGILEVTEMARFFYFIYRSLYVGLLVLFPLTVIISFVRFIQDLKLEKMIERGLTVK